MLDDDFVAGDPGGDAPTGDPGGETGGDEPVLTVATSRNRLRRTLIRRTQELGPTEHGEIFKILTSHGIDHTQNSNGIFVNLSRVPDEVLDKVQRFVEYCVENKHDLDEYDKRLNECKRSQDYERFMGVMPNNSADGNNAHVVTTTTEAATSSDQVLKLSSVAVTDPLPAAAPPYGGPKIGPRGDSVVVTSVAKRILNSKFHQAKKKYSKRKVTAERRTHATDGNSNASAALLKPEPYLV